MYKILHTKTSLKHIPLLQASHLDSKAKAIIEILKINPFQNPPSYEKLVGNFKDMYSRRINVKHRLVYMVDEELKVVKILSMWSHYEQ